MSRIAFRNFTGGEVTPTLCARYDLKKFGSFLQTCRNFVPNLHGDVERRPGTKYIASLGANSILIPFQFNTQPENNYVLIFQSGTIYIAQADGMLETTLAHNYNLSDVYGISFAQVGDVLYLAHPKYPLQKISRSDAEPGSDYQYAWTIAPVSINQSLSAPGRPTVTWHRGSGDGNTDNENATLNYVVTTVDSNGVESTASKIGKCKGRYPTDWIVGDYVTISWTAVTDAAEYNIYRESAGYYGYIGTTSNTSFDDQNYEPDTAQTPKKDWNPFANGNYPSSVCFHQQRMWLGGGAKNPATIYASRTGDYESFRKSMPLQDDDALEYVLASGSIDDVKWIVSFDNLLIGTAGAEYKCAASKSSAITPSDCQITVQSYWGSKDLQPLIIGQSIMHCQRSGNHVRDLYYTLESDGYSGNDLSVLAPQLVESNSIVQWCYQQSPNSCVWAVRDDGVLLCLTYMKEQNVFGWSRHVTDGKVKSVAVINGEEEDVVMMVVERKVNRTTQYYLERLMPRFKDANDIKGAWYVDAGMMVSPENITRNDDGDLVVCSGLEHLAGKTVSVLSDGSPEEHVVSEDGTISLDFPVEGDGEGHAWEGVKVLVGLGYTSAMCPLPMETDMQQTGTTLGKRRAYGKCVLRMYRSVGGSYAASRLDGMWDADEWRNVQFYELPFLPEKWGEPCQPYSGDLEISLPSGQDPTTSIWIKQDKPLPLRVVSIMCEVHFGEV